MIIFTLTLMEHCCHHLHVYLDLWLMMINHHQ